MPYMIVKRDNEWCVAKEQPDKSPGDTVGCHPSEAQAKEQMRALYANVPDAKSVPGLKFMDAAETELRGLLAPFGGIFNGSDIVGERFTARTDFVLDWFPGDRPLLYQHGLDPKAGPAVVGRIKALDRDDMGLWMQAQLDARSEYYAAIRQLVQAGKLSLSSGSMRHLVQVDKSGEIRRWPLIEGSLTPTPANPLANVELVAVKAHYAAIGQEVPDLETLGANKAGLAGLVDQCQDIALADHAGYTASMAASLAQRTKDLRERRALEDRELSHGNLDSLRQALQNIKAAVTGLAELTSSGVNGKAEADAQSLRRLRAQFESLRLRSMCAYST